MADKKKFLSAEGLATLWGRILSLVSKELDDFKSSFVDEPVDALDSKYAAQLGVINQRLNNCALASTLNDVEERLEAKKQDKNVVTVRPVLVERSEAEGGAYYKPTPDMDYIEAESILAAGGMLTLKWLDSGGGVLVFNNCRRLGLSDAYVTDIEATTVSDAVSYKLTWNEAGTFELKTTELMVKTTLAPIAKSGEAVDVKYTRADNQRVIRLNRMLDELLTAKNADNTTLLTHSAAISDLREVVATLGNKKYKVIETKFSDASAIEHGVVYLWKNGDDVYEKLLPTADPSGAVTWTTIGTMEDDFGLDGLVAEGDLAGLSAEEIALACPLPQTSVVAGATPESISD